MRAPSIFLATILMAGALAGCGDESAPTGGASQTQDERGDAGAGTGVEPGGDAGAAGAEEAEGAEGTGVEGEGEGEGADAAEEAAEAGSDEPTSEDYDAIISPYLSLLIDDPGSADSADVSSDLEAVADGASGECKAAAVATAGAVEDESGTPEDRRARILEAAAPLSAC